MFKKLMAATALTTALFASGASAQNNDPFVGFYTVGEIGYDNGGDGFDQLIYGGAFGLNIPLDEQWYFGGEGAIHGSTSSLIDFTYEFTANLGYRLDTDLVVFARAGYREFNFDDFGSDGDYTLGLGAQYALSENLSFRPIIDTVAFDTIGVRAGIAYSF